MIQANELMLGNFVDTPDGTVKITAISYEKVAVIRKTEKGNFAVYSESLDDIQPIPLTEEILLKCGAEPFAGGGLILNYRRIEYAECRQVYYDVFTSVELKYLHQLQNLFYVLAGEELEVNL